MPDYSWVFSLPSLRDTPRRRQLMKEHKDCVMREHAAHVSRNQQSEETLKVDILDFLEKYPPEHTKAVREVIFEGYTTEEAAVRNKVSRQTILNIRKGLRDAFERDL